VKIAARSSSASSEYGRVHLGVAKSDRSDLIDIANHRFGCHVLNKAMESDDLQVSYLY
jgi:hypothetical protein